MLKRIELKKKERMNLVNVIQSVSNENMWKAAWSHRDHMSWQKNRLKEFVQHRDRKHLEFNTITASIKESPRDSVCVFACRPEQSRYFLNKMALIKRHARVKSKTSTLSIDDIQTYVFVFSFEVLQILILSLFG